MTKVHGYLHEIAQRLWDRGGAPGSGRASVMVGSGFSQNARPRSSIAREFPIWEGIAKAIVERLYPQCETCNCVGNVTGKLNCVNGEQRRRRLEGGRETSGALRLAEMYEVMYGRAALEGLLAATIPNRQHQPGEAHQRLVRLPWADIFTTNWDKMLEDAVDLYDRSYSIVNSVGQIAIARAPRIVKLHGTLEVGSRLIVTEGDYMRYPREYAPFVSLVQQSIVENTFVLLGFSGEDPNFLHWLDWVRAQLGDYVQQVFLIGRSDPDEVERRLLAKRGVIPLNIGELAESEEERRDYPALLNRFFDTLEKLREPYRANLDWPTIRYFKGDPLAGAQALDPFTQLVALWEKRMREAPQWLALPSSNLIEFRGYLPCDDWSFDELRTTPDLRDLVRAVSGTAYTSQRRSADNKNGKVDSKTKESVKEAEHGVAWPLRFRAAALLASILRTAHAELGPDAKDAIATLAMPSIAALVPETETATGPAESDSRTATKSWGSDQSGAWEKLCDVLKAQSPASSTKKSSSKHRIRFGPPADDDWQPDDAQLSVIYGAVQWQAFVENADAMFEWATGALLGLSRSTDAAKYAEFRRVSWQIQHGRVSAAAKHLRTLERLIGREHARPAWALRHGALALELRDYAGARAIFQRSSDQVRKLRIDSETEHDSIWRASREAWIYFGYKMLVDEVDPADYAAFRGDSDFAPNVQGVMLGERLSEARGQVYDPRHEITAIDGQLVAAAIELRLALDAGDEPRLQRARRRARSTALALFGFAETVGLLLRSVLHEDTRISLTYTAAMMLMPELPTTALGALLRYASSDDIVRARTGVLPFARMLAILPAEKVAELVEALTSYARNVLAALDEWTIDEHYAVARLQMTLSAASEIVASVSATAAKMLALVEMFHVGPAARHVSRFGPILENIANQCLESAPDDAILPQVEQYLAQAIRAYQGRIQESSVWPDPYAALFVRDEAGNLALTERALRLAREMGDDLLQKMDATINAAREHGLAGLASHLEAYELLTGAARAHRGGQ